MYASVSPDIDKLPAYLGHGHGRSDTEHFIINVQVWLAAEF